MQQALALVDRTIIALDLPDPDVEVLRSIQWGRFEETLTPAFWAVQVWMDPVANSGRFALGDNLAEEVVACLLGGHGAPAEIGLAAFARVVQHIREFGLELSESQAIELLSEPLEVGGRTVRYRFARQRGRYLAACLAGLAKIDDKVLSDVELRNELCELPGVGPKTASWIVRNRRGSDEVAILDVHIMRACIRMGVFQPDATPSRAYRDLERRFIDFSRSIGVRPSVMDAVMWRTMRSMGSVLTELLLSQSNPSHNPSLGWGR